MTFPVRIAATDWSVAPKSNDQGVIGGQTYQVVSINTRRPFREATMHSVQVRGANGNVPSLARGAVCLLAVREGICTAQSPRGASCPLASSTI
jgi:hypothetical protein